MLPCAVRRVILVRHRVDFRRRFDGLLAEAYRLGFDPYHGECVVFIMRDRTQARAIVGDAFGLFLVCRRFEGGRLGPEFRCLNDPTATEITTAELAMLFEGASFTTHRRVRPWQTI